MAFWKRKTNWEDEYDEDYIRERRPAQPLGTSKFWYVPHVLSLMFVGVLFVGAVGTIAGKTMAEKLATSLATPTGIVWLTLILMVYFCLMTRQAWPALVGIFCWIVLTVGGNKFVADQLIRTLERPYLEMDVFDQDPFETIILLGGGTGTNLAGRSEATLSGDRVTLAAQLFHSGLTQKIVCTGSQSFRSTEADLHPREEATNILLRLNVPEHCLLQMRGNNTSEEMKNLKTWLNDNDMDGRIGIVTSAWHMPRALRLAKSHDLILQPIPADFLSEPFAPSPNLIVPSSENLLITSRVVKEYLARLVGR